MTPTVAYAVAAATDSQIHEALAARFRLEVEDQARRRVRYFDTFDWRIHRAGGCLRLAPGRRPHGVPASRDPVLSWLREDGSLRHRMVGPEVPAFAWGFPQGAFRRDLAPVIAMRRLLPVVELELSGRTLRILDGREKTVVRLRLEDARATVPQEARAADPIAYRSPSGSLPGLLRVLPVRGYDPARRRVVRFLESELGLEEVAGSELDLALAAVGRRAGDYTSKVRIELDPALPAAEAAKTFHRSLLATIGRNEAGTRQDLDSEFLHDFRVAVRRTRSALSQIKGVYPEGDLARFKSELKWLGGLTGPTRDLDVYLLKMDDYRAELAAARRHLEPLGEFLRARQRREQRRMARHLAGSRYRRLLAAWQAFLDEPADLEAAANAGRPVIEVARRRLFKVYRRALRLGEKIDDGSPAEALHRLRIECKKLRYLMELFAGLFEGGEIGRLIKALKRLQDNLGDFNDYQVQQESLVRFAAEMRGSAPAATLMAMGRLVEHLEAGQARERRRFGERFAKFARQANQRLARELFAG